MPAKFYVGIKAVIIQQGKLLVLKKADPAEGVFGDLPGGRMEFGENPEDALRRELREELPGLPKFEIGEVLGARKRQSPLVDGTELCLIYYRVTVPKFEVKLSDEHTEFKWLGRAEIEQLDEPHRGVYGKMMMM